jgi:hypothetical protein
MKELLLRERKVYKINLHDSAGGASKVRITLADEKRA